MLVSSKRTRHMKQGLLSSPWLPVSFESVFERKIYKYVIISDIQNPVCRQTQLRKTKISTSTEGKMVQSFAFQHTHSSAPCSFMDIGMGAITAMVAYRGAVGPHHTPTVKQLHWFHCQLNKHLIQQIRHITHRQKRYYKQKTNKLL